MHHGRKLAGLEQGAHEVTLVFEDGTRVAAFGQGVFDTPHSLTLSKTGDIWVTDQGGNTIRKFTPDGQLALTIGTAGQAGDPRVPRRGPLAGRVIFSRRISRLGGKFHAIRGSTRVLAE